MQDNSDFIDTPLNGDTLYLYVVRRSLQAALDKNMHHCRGTVLDLGCGEMPYKDYLIGRNRNISHYIGVDINFSPDHQTTRPDLFWDGKSIPVADRSIDTVIATELFEHVSDLNLVLSEV